MDNILKTTCINCDHGDNMLIVCVVPQRNLTDYFAAVEPSNMILIFAR